MNKIIKAKLDRTRIKQKETQLETLSSKNIRNLTPIKLKLNSKRQYQKSPDSFISKLRKLTPEPNRSSPIINFERSSTNNFNNSKQLIKNPQLILKKSTNKIIIRKTTPLQLKNSSNQSIYNYHFNAVNCIDINGNDILSGSSDYFVKVYNVNNKLCRIECKHKHPVIGISKSNEKIISISSRGLIKISNKHLLEKSLHSQVQITCMKLMRNNQLISLGKNIDFWDLNYGKLFRNTIEEEFCISSIGLHSEFTFIIGCDSFIKLWDIRAPRSILKLGVHKDIVTGILVENNKVYTCSLDKTLKLWDINKSLAISERKTDSSLRKIIKCNDNIYTAGEKIILWSSIEKIIAIGNFKDIGYCENNNSIIAGSSYGCVHEYPLEN